MLVIGAVAFAAAGTSGAKFTASTPASAGSYQSCVIAHESSGNPQAVNASSGAGGLYQFLPSTWASTPWGAQYPGGAQTAPVGVQDQAFQWLFAQDGKRPWITDGC